MAEALVALLGEQLLSGTDKVQTGEALAGKTTCILYFSAHWCPPCRGFTPVLTEAYKEYKAAEGGEAEVVFVSWDNDLSSFQGYFETMPWLAVPYEGTDALRQELGQKFNVNGIPNLVALGPDGQRINYGEGVDLRSIVGLHKGAAFPMTPAHIREVEAEQLRRAQAALPEACAELSSISAPGDEAANVALAELLGAFEHVALVFGDGDGSDDSYATIATVQAAVNKPQEEEKQRLAIVYLGWKLYNAASSHEPFAKKHHSVLNVPDELKKKLELQCKAGVNPPHVLVLRLGEGGSPEIVANDPGTRRMKQWRAAGYPWGDARVAELEAEAANRVQRLKEQQVNLQFLKGADGRDGLLANDGREVKVDELAAMGSDAIVGLYFSAHWCPPCRGFTPMLAKVHSALKAADKKFEVVFISSDRDGESFNEYFSQMPWLSLPYAERDLKEALSTVFNVRGIPTLILLRPDGTMLTAEGTDAVQVGADYFPWRPEDLARGAEDAKAREARATAEALQAEEAALEDLRGKGEPLLRRLRGLPGKSVAIDASERKLAFNQFSTAGAPDKLATAGILYYEIELVVVDRFPQIGFALGEFETSDTSSGEGVGDDVVSWGLDGSRALRWYMGNPVGWACKWEVGDVIGLAANIDVGKVAVSKNGSWSEEHNGVVFESERIKAGVYPALSATGYTLRYNLDGDKHGPYKYGPPPEEVWGTAPPS